jgi:hypothetical protein
VTEGAKRPPHARGADDPAHVVDDHPVAAADAERAHGTGEVIRGRQHVGQGIGVVRDGVDVEEHRARDVLLLEVRARVTLELGHVPAAVDDADVGIAEVRGEPLGPDDGVVHGGMILPASAQAAGGVG